MLTKVTRRGPLEGLSVGWVTNVDLRRTSRRQGRGEAGGEEGAKLEEQGGDGAEVRRVWSPKMHQLFGLQSR